MSGIRLVLVVSAVFFALTGATFVMAFAEEPLYFRDPYTSEITDDEVNSIHFDLTYAMALAAGFSITDSKQIQLWDQLVDSEQLGPGDLAAYSNCSGSFNAPPSPEQVCSPGVDTSQVAWPLWDEMQDQTSCATSRFGPYSPFFHFPRNNPGELGALHDWGWGYADVLVGYEAYAWGGLTVLNADCTYTQTVIISTSMQAGSLEAFATYLHSLGDYYSHRECLSALDTIDAPWGTHTNPLGSDIYECNYILSSPNNLDAHGREYGTAHPSDSDRTVEAIKAIYAELVFRSLRREGVHYPLALSAPLNGLDGAATLEEAFTYFVQNWPFDNPANPGAPASARRSYADLLAQAVLVDRSIQHRLYLPDLKR